MSGSIQISFNAKIEIIGINPFVFLPARVLKALIKQAKRETAPIPIRGSINDKPYKQTLVRYAGSWRLYINTTMLKNSPKRIGEKVSITVQFDDTDRTIPLPPGLALALQDQPLANAAFEKLPAYRQKEIARYIANLKTEESIRRNVEKAVQHLLGKQRFAGRD